MSVPCLYHALMCAGVEMCPLEVTAATDEVIGGDVMIVHEIIITTTVNSIKCKSILTM